MTFRALWLAGFMFRWQLLTIVIIDFRSLTLLLAQAALRAPTEVALQCIAGHCYYHHSVSLFLSFLKSLALAQTQSTPKVTHTPPPHPHHTNFRTLPRHLGRWFSVCNLSSPPSWLIKEGVPEVGVLKSESSSQSTQVGVLQLESSSQSPQVRVLSWSLQSESSVQVQA